MTIEKATPSEEIPPEWRFLNQPMIKELNTLLDTSLSSSRTGEERAAALLNFKKGMKNLLATLPTLAENDPLLLNQILLFIRQNMRLLGKRKFNYDCSEQNESLMEVNTYFLENHKDLWEKVVGREKGSK
jgi:hypothetical protein